jgi:hypothetical protein
MHITGGLLARLGLATVSAILVACSTQSATFAPDGRRAFVVTCGGYLGNWSSCLVQAGKACGSRGYDRIEGDEDDRRLLVACKAP